MVDPASVSVRFWKTVVVLSSGSSVKFWDRVKVVVAVGPCSVMVLSIGFNVTLSVGPGSVIVLPGVLEMQRSEFEGIVITSRLQSCL
jgi:hypothetical protein